MAAGWTALEKRRLLYALYQYGPANTDALHEMVPTKTKTEIKVLCEEHKKLSLKKSDEDSKAPAVKLWLQLFKKLKGRQTKPEDIVPRVLKYIALFEHNRSVSFINLKRCYLALASMCRGLDFEHLDEPNNYFLFECLRQMAKHLKHGESSYFRRHIKSLTTFEDLFRHRTNPESKVENSFVLNPLGVPDELLQLPLTVFTMD